MFIPGTEFNKNKDKLFFFWNQEYYRQRLPIGGTTQFYTPTALERQGDFSQSTDATAIRLSSLGAGITQQQD